MGCCRNCLVRSLHQQLRHANRQLSLCDITSAGASKLVRSFSYKAGWLQQYRALCFCGEPRFPWRRHNGKISRAVLGGCRHAEECGWSCYYWSLAHMPTCLLCVPQLCVRAGSVSAGALCLQTCADQQLMSSGQPVTSAAASVALLLLPVSRSGCCFGVPAPLLTLFLSQQLGRSWVGFWGAPCPALPHCRADRCPRKSCIGCARLPHRVHACLHALMGTRLP